MKDRMLQIGYRVIKIWVVLEFSLSAIYMTDSLFASFKWKREFADWVNAQTPPFSITAILLLNYLPKLLRWIVIVTVLWALIKYLLHSKLDFKKVAVGTAVSIGISLFMIFTGIYHFFGADTVLGKIIFSFVKFMQFSTPTGALDFILLIPLFLYAALLWHDISLTRKSASNEIPLIYKQVVGVWVFVQFTGTFLTNLNDLALNYLFAPISFLAEDHIHLFFLIRFVVDFLLLFAVWFLFLHIGKLDTLLSFPDSLEQKKVLGKTFLISMVISYVLNYIPFSRAVYHLFDLIFLGVGGSGMQIGVGVLTILYLALQKFQKGNAKAEAVI